MNFAKFLRTLFFKKNSSDYSDVKASSDSITLNEMERNNHKILVLCFTLFLCH